MTPEQINIAIAEACGWKEIEWYEDYSCPGFWSGIPQIIDEDALKLTRERLIRYRFYGIKIPDYYHDLNAMHEAPLTLDGTISIIPEEKGHETQRDRFISELENIVERDCPEEDIYWKAINATSAQCAEAFLRTIGKWVES